MKYGLSKCVFMCAYPCKCKFVSVYLYINRYLYLYMYHGFPGSTDPSAWGIMQNLWAYVGYIPQCLEKRKAFF